MRDENGDILCASSQHLYGKAVLNSTQCYTHSTHSIPSYIHWGYPDTIRCVLSTVHDLIFRSLLKKDDEVKYQRILYMNLARDKSESTILLHFGENEIDC